MTSVATTIVHTTEKVAVRIEPDKPALWENLIATSLMLMLSMVGLFAYTSVIYVIWRDFNMKFKNSFYPLVLSLAVSDVIMLVLFLFYSVPLTISQNWPLGETFDIVMGMLATIGFCSSLPCIIAIALNRYWAICRYDTYVQVFSPRSVKIFIAGFWVFGLAPNIANSVPVFCTVRYYPEYYTWSYDVNLWGCVYFIYSERIACVIVGITLITCYVLIFLKRREQNRIAAQLIKDNAQLVERQKAEGRLALNFWVVAVYLMIFDIVFTTLPLFTTYRWHNLISSVMYIVNCSINPCIYIALNTDIRTSLQNSVVGNIFWKQNSQGDRLSVVACGQGQ